MSKSATSSCIPGHFVLDLRAMPTDRTHMGRSNITDRPPVWSREGEPRSGSLAVFGTPRTLGADAAQRHV